MAPRMRSFCKKRVESQVSSQGKLWIMRCTCRILHTKDKSQASLGLGPAPPPSDSEVRSGR